MALRSAPSMHEVSLPISPGPLPPRDPPDEAAARNSSRNSATLTCYASSPRSSPAEDFIPDLREALREEGGARVRSFEPVAAEDDPDAILPSLIGTTDADTGNAVIASFMMPRRRLEPWRRG